MVGQSGLSPWTMIRIASQVVLGHCITGSWFANIYSKCWIVNGYMSMYARLESPPLEKRTFGFSLPSLKAPQIKIIPGYTSDLKQSFCRSLLLGEAIELIKSSAITVMRLFPWGEESEATRCDRLSSDLSKVTNFLHWLPDFCHAVSMPKHTAQKGRCIWAQGPFQTMHRNAASTGALAPGISGVDLGEDLFDA